MDPSEDISSSTDSPILWSLCLIFIVFTFNVPWLLGPAPSKQSPMPYSVLSVSPDVMLIAASAYFAGDHDKYNKKLKFYYLTQTISSILMAIPLFIAIILSIILIMRKYVAGYLAYGQIYGLIAFGTLFIPSVLQKK